LGREALHAALRLRADELRGRLRLPGLALELVLGVRCDLRKDRGRDEAERSCRQSDSPETSIHDVSLPLYRRFVVARRAHSRARPRPSNDDLTLRVSTEWCQRTKSARVEEKLGIDTEKNLASILNGHADALRAEHHAHTLASVDSWPITRGAMRRCVTL